MPLEITITAGAPQTDIEPGAYEVTLLAIEGPRTILPQSGPNAGKEVDLYDWTFTLEDGTELQGSTSTKSGPKSKLYAWVTALLGGTPPPTEAKFKVDDLVGRMAIATVTIDDGGWPRIQQLGPVLATKSRTKPQPVSATAKDDEPF